MASPTWGVGGSAPPEVRERKRLLEAAVNEVLGGMSLLWLDVGDAAGPGSERGCVERNAIALLSNHGRPELDPPSAGWLGRHAASGRIRSSGLWNSSHVDEPYDPSFLGRLDRLVAAT